MSNILFISRYYLPEKAAAAVRVSETAKRLVQRGHQVTVLTTVPNYPMGIVPSPYQNCLLQEENIDGVRVIRVWSYIYGNKGFLRRVIAQLSFGCFAPFLAWKAIGQPDVTIVNSPPLFTVIAARILAWLKGCPYIFWVADLWPESAVQLGILRNRLFIRLSEWLERSTYQRAFLVWVVTQGVRDLLIQRGLSPERIFLLTNGVDTSKFCPSPQAQARAHLGWNHRFTVLYAGNHGLVYSMMTVLDAAEQLQSDPDIHIVLVGDGIQKADLIAEARRRNLNNVTFLDPIPHDQMPQLLTAADVGLIPLRKLPLLKTTFALKMFELMACERPFVLAGEGIACQLAEQEACAGICIEPENADALVSAILYLRTHPKEAEALGQRGRAYVQTHFDYDQLIARLDQRLEVLLQKDSSVFPSLSPNPVPLPKMLAPEIPDVEPL